VVLGSDPVVATVYFGGREGMERIRAASNEDGEFELTLPRAGNWRVDVDVAEPPVRRRFRQVEVEEPKPGRIAEVELRLPDTRVFGSVRKADGAALGGRTIVYALHDTASESHQALLPDGTYEFRGLSEGVVRIHAMGSEGGRLRRSATHLVTTTDGSEQRVDLVLEDTKVLRGLVTADYGAVPGATITVLPDKDPVWGVPKLAADAEGRFETWIPGDTSYVDITISAPGYTLGTARASVQRSGDSEALVRLDQAGGSLRIVGWTETAADGRSLLLFREGVLIAPGEVELWRHLNPDAMEGSDYVIPALMEGTYHACIASDGSAARRMTPGGRQLESCSAGSLARFGELTLQLDAPSGDGGGR
jgi:hypothetical protein